MFKDRSYDVIVVGAGHAGSEAAAAAANLGSSVLLITMNMGTIAQMSCNPAMGGIAKGQIVREIDAMGGYSGIVSDKSAIQFRMLNRSKGPAMWSPRSQNDRVMFALEWRKMLEETPKVDFWQEMVTSIIVEGHKVTGVRTSLGIEIRAKTVILTSGTFLNGQIHIGEKSFGGGRTGEKAALGLTEDLVSYGFEAGRMKTGTPPRVDGRSLDYSKMEEQLGDEHPGRFSFLNGKRNLENQRSCHITYTNPAVHEILRDGFDRSPMFNDRIKGIGPRYCPSVEEKINRFADRDRHQIFVEPEGWNTVEVYVNGFSTSLPESVQYNALKKVVGFENVKFFRPGYAIEYDYFPPTQLNHSLETKILKNLFFAGQINGTTGYEEAAGQGLMAGINAHLNCEEKGPLVLGREQAYIGVLIDDLITKGTDEPYRMFTSRAEFRILLRQDNADERLTPLSYELGLANEDRMRNLERKGNEKRSLRAFMDKSSISPEEINPLLISKESSPIKQKVKLSSLVLRPQLSIKDLQASHNKLSQALMGLENESVEQAEIEIKYEGYILREKELVDKMNRLEAVQIDASLDYDRIKSLSMESRQKLMKVRPTTLGQASRISGVSPADISVLMVHLGR
ncbi:MAG: tRNA uridine-5-carboxymethylaminomethyl(34) synthesis enzyme MnmG [Vicingaceae bacterium]